MKNKVTTSIRILQSFYERQATKLVILYSLVVGILATFYFYSNNLITVLVDQNAHLNISRQVIDSLTPGVSQFGSWPPFSQIIMIPFVWNDFLWHSGLAGSIPILICFIITTVFIYKSALFLSKSHFASIIAILLFSLNPNMLELAVSPLMEMPFFMFSILTFYYVCRWLKQERIFYLSAAAFFSTMAALTRFDGFVFPFIIAGIIILKYLVLKRGLRRLEATLIVFLFLGLFGIATDLLYNAVFLGDPLAFARGSWSAYAQQHIEGSLLPSEHSIKNSIIYYGQSVIDNIGFPLTIISLLSLPIILALKRNINYLFLFFLLATPVFYLLALYQGSVIIFVKELPPYFITNTRYGTSFILFSSLIPALAFGLLLKRDGLNKLLKVVISLVMISGVLFYGVGKITTGAIDQTNYEFLYNGERGKDLFTSVDLLRENYDGGKILITRGVNDILVNSAGIHISNLIQESNYIFWQKSLETPWFYARYIVMVNPKYGGVSTARDEISKKWFGKQEIYSFYDILLNNNRYQILKINEDRLREYAWKNNLNIKEMPSINTSLSRWDPNLQGEKIKLAGVTNTVSDLTPKVMLAIAWDEYKRKYISVQGQVVTNDLERPTTSEGQSYALLRAVIMNDRSTFQKVLDWTEKNLRVNETQEASKSATAKDSKNEVLKKHLFSWLWGKKSNGDYGIKDAGNATDADEDIALALLFAYKEWGNLDYLNQAKIIINDIWKYETVEIKGGRYIVAGNWASAKENKIFTINPSYLAPYAYRIFAEVDTQHDWNGLVDTSYEILNKCSESTFDFSRSANIPPDWCALDKNGKVVKADNISNKSTNYSYDALRTLWRVALDYQWNKEPRALSYLQQMGLWQKEWSKQQKIYASYSHDGTPLQNTESLAHYGTQLAFFSVVNPDIAGQIYKQKIFSQWNKDGFWGDKNNYYDQNWAWFGTALYTDNLPNLWQK